MNPDEYLQAKQALIENEREASKNSLLFVKKLIENGVQLDISIEEMEKELIRALGSYERSCTKLENEFDYPDNDLHFNTPLSE